MLYLGSDRELEIPKFDYSNPKVSITEKIKKSQTVVHHFSKLNVYYVASTEGCGCSFKQEEDVLYPDLSRKESINQNQFELLSLLESILLMEHSIELFGSWAGDEKELKSKKIISIGELKDKNFYFKDNELLVVRK